MRKQTLVTVHLLVNLTDENEIADGLSGLLSEIGMEDFYGQPPLLTDWGYLVSSDGKNYDRGKVVEIADEDGYEEGEFYPLIN